MLFVQNIISLWKYSLFFLLLTVLLFLGDGKQYIVDVVAVAGVLSLFILRKTSAKFSINTSLPLQVAWGSFLLYLIFRSIFSDSIGYSIYAIIRWFIAYLVFVYFATISSEKEKKKHFVGLSLLFGVAAVLVSFAVQLKEQWGLALPGMNLLYPTYGHNHIAVLLVFMVPIISRSLLEKANKRTVGITALFIFSLVISLARGAWLLLGAYICLLLPFSRFTTAKQRTVGFFSACLIVGAMLILSQRLVSLPSS